MGRLACALLLAAGFLPEAARADLFRIPIARDLVIVSDPFGLLPALGGGNPDLVGYWTVESDALDLDPDPAHGEWQFADPALRLSLVFGAGALAYDFEVATIRSAFSTAVLPTGIVYDGSYVIETRPAPPGIPGIATETLSVRFSYGGQLFGLPSYSPSPLPPQPFAEGSLSGSLGLVGTNGLPGEDERFYGLRVVHPSYGPATLVPEPATAALLGGALAALAAVRRRAGPHAGGSPCRAALGSSPSSSRIT
jgi:hypothetical protein